MKDLRARIDRTLAPLKVCKDRILSARSADGVHWVRDRGVRVDVGKGELNDDQMVYSCFVKHTGSEDWPLEMYFQGSSFREGRWHSRIRRVVSKDALLWAGAGDTGIANGAAPLCANRVTHPWLLQLGGNERMFFTGSGEDGVYRILSSTRPEGPEWRIDPVPALDPADVDAAVRNTRRSSNSSIVGLSDPCVVRTGDGSLRMYFAAFRDAVHYQDICSARSDDGTSWRPEPGYRIAAGANGMKGVVNNPCVLRVDRKWRMYFRGTDRLPLDSNIYLAESDDGLLWDRPRLVLPVRRWGLYERHGVGFPFVLKQRDGSYRMYYTGYWGNWLCHETVRYYEEYHKELESNQDM